MPTLEASTKGIASPQTKPAEPGFGETLQYASANALSLKKDMTGRNDCSDNVTKAPEPQSAPTARRTAEGAKSKVETRTSATNSAKDKSERERADRTVSGRATSERKGDIRGKNPAGAAESQPPADNELPISTGPIVIPVSVASANSSSAAEAGNLVNAEPPHDGTAGEPIPASSATAAASVGSSGQVVESLDVPANQQAASAGNPGGGAASSAVAVAVAVVTNASDALQTPGTDRASNDLPPTQSQSDSTTEESPFSRSGDPSSQVPEQLNASSSQQPDDRKKNGLGPAMAQLLQQAMDTNLMPSAKEQVLPGNGAAANPSPAEAARKLFDAAGSARGTDGANHLPLPFAQASPTMVTPNIAAIAPLNPPPLTALKSAANNSNANGNGRTSNSQGQANLLEISDPTQSSAGLAKAASDAVMQTEPAPKSVPAAGQSSDAVLTVPAMPVAMAGLGEAATPSVSSARSQTPGAAEDPGRPDDEVRAPDSINVAKLVQRLNESEMRVGIHSVEFGNIAIKTSVGNERLTAEISLDHNGVGKALAEQLPALQSKLGGEFGMQATFEIHQTSSGVSGGLNQGSPQQSQQQGQPASQSVQPLRAGREAGQLPVPRVATPVAVSDARLDVRA